MPTQAKWIKESEDVKKALLNVMEDWSEAKEMMEKEKATDEAMLASIGEGLVALDNHGIITVVNKVAEQMFGYSADDLLGKGIMTLVFEDEAGEIIQKEKRPSFIVIGTGKSYSTVLYFRRKNNTRYPVAVNITPIKLRGKTIGLIETLRDVTIEVEIDKAKSEFVSLASHQLRTPLGIVKWSLEALQGVKYLQKSPTEVKKFLDTIYKSNERVISLVRELLSVSRIEQGKVTNEPSEVNIITIVREVVEQLKVLAEKKKTSIVVDVSSEQIPKLEMDSLRIHEVIQNLIVNAIEYSKPNGKIIVAVNKVGDNVIISIEDFGIGISTLDSKKLFSKFFRSAKAMEQNPEGTGLGLYIVKSYIEGWGGTITAESKDSAGSLFTIKLPISQLINK